MPRSLCAVTFDMTQSGIKNFVKVVIY